MLFSNLNRPISDTVMKLFLKCTKFTVILIRILRNQIAFLIKSKYPSENSMKV